MADDPRMRFSLVFVLAAAAASGLVRQEPVEVSGGPPIEIRLEGRVDPLLESRIQEIQAAFPGLERHRTRRFEIVSDLPHERIMAHGRLLERTAHAVEAFRRELGIGWGRDWDTDPSGRELAIAFASREDFIAFALDEGCRSARWLGGYYSPDGGHLVYVDTADHPRVRRAKRAAARNVASFPAATTPDPASPELERHVRRENATLVVHEAVHLLLDRRGILSATAAPIWLSEGIAASFEPVEPERSFGPDRTINARTAAFREGLRERRTPSVRTLICWRHDAARTDVHLHYAAAASLCSWLVRHRPDELRAYLRSFRDGIGTPVTPAEEVARFEGCFGDPDEIERAWIGREWTLAFETGDESHDP